MIYVNVVQIQTRSAIGNDDIFVAGFITCGSTGFFIGKTAL
jgi:hypothetical protein